MDTDQARRIDEATSSPAPGRVVVIGCGNLLRGDDGVGPRVVQRLADVGVPDNVTLVDGGLAGMNVVSAMRGSAKVVLIDAASTGAEPGTIFRLSGGELHDLKATAVVVSHDLRWRHALALGRFLHDDDHPDDIVALLVEVAHTEAGAPLSGAVEQSMGRLDSLVRAEWGGPP